MTIEIPKHKERVRNVPLALGDLPEDGFVRLPVVLRHFPVSRSTWWAGVKSGRYPRPVRLSARIVAWDVREIRNLISKATHER